LPAPGTVSTLLTSGPSGIPAAVHAPGSDSRSYPLLGFGPPTRYFPKSPPAASRPKAPLLGFVAPTAHTEEGAHGSPVARSSSPRFPGVPPSGPTQPATAPLAGFPNLSAACRSHRPPAIFQAGGAPGVPPSRGSCLSRSPGNSSLPACPRDVLPTECACPRPRRGLRWARLPLPRSIGRSHWPSSGLSSA
jgi:hypothetical protein